MKFSFKSFCFSVFFVSSLFAFDFPDIQSPNQLTTLFPKTPQEIQEKTEKTIEEINLTVKNLREQDILSFEELYAPLDEALAYLMMYSCQLEALTLVEPNDALREEAEQNSLLIQKYSVDLFSNEHELYNKLNACYQKQGHLMSKDQKYLAKYLLKEFELVGHSLSADQREQIRHTLNELSEIENQFSINIQKDNSQLLVKKEDLDGVQKNMLDSFSKEETGEIRLGCDYPSYFSVMTTCTNSSTRKNFYQLFNRRAFPNNEEILAQMIQKRDDYATLLGYKSYNDLMLEEGMAKSSNTALSFLNELSHLSSEKRKQEFEQFIGDLPPNVKLSPEGKIYPWDQSYITDYHRKKYYQVDHEKIAEFFPFQETFNGLMSIYEQFFNISIEEVQGLTFWHEDVRTLKISEKNGDLIGYVLLDLFPRKNKFSHACDVSGMTCNFQEGTQSRPAVDLIVANFTKPSPERPSLLKHNEVVTFFHEFGHALHNQFASNRLKMCCGIASPLVKRDYVELPSQLLENWMWQPSILKSLSSHYQTGEPLSDEQINKLIESKNMASGFMIQRQAYLSYLALNFFSEGRDKDVYQITNELKNHLFPYLENNKEDYFCMSFGHLPGYGPFYYGYLWTMVYAQDVFDEVKKQGLLNSEIGMRYRKQILSRGGSQDPNELLQEFLGRKPSMQPFVDNLGFKK